MAIWNGEGVCVWKQTTLLFKTEAEAAQEPRRRRSCSPVKCQVRACRLLYSTIKQDRGSSAARRRQDFMCYTRPLLVLASLGSFRGSRSSLIVARRWSLDHIHLQLYNARWAHLRHQNLYLSPLAAQRTNRVQLSPPSPHRQQEQEH